MAFLLEHLERTKTGPVVCESQIVMKCFGEVYLCLVCASNDGQEVRASNSKTLRAVSCSSASMVEHSLVHRGLTSHTGNHFRSAVVNWSGPLKFI